jgi:two-component system chemotaxis response regulator CheV
LDFSSLLSKNAGSTSLAQSSRLLICELKNTYVAIPIEKMSRVVTCTDQDFFPPPSGGAMESSRWVTGLIRKDGVFIPVMDIESLMERIFGKTDRISDRAKESSKKYAGKKILVVDDSKSVLKHLIQFFEGIGFSVVSAGNGKEALDKVLDPAAEFDLIFTDIEMPQMNGIAFARSLRSTPRWANIPIIFNSSLSNPMLIADTESERLGHYLVKFDEDLILRHLEIIFNQSQPFTI